MKVIGERVIIEGVKVPAVEVDLIEVPVEAMEEVAFFESFD